MADFDNIEKCARDFIELLEFDDIRFLRAHKQAPDTLVTILIEGEMTRHIRNHYGLWYSNPLTKRWREDESSRIIIDGLDMSPDHPDNISRVIFLRAVEIARAEYSGPKGVKNV
jgi:hypothetical protein